MEPLPILGVGGFGIVYELPDGRAMKVLHDNFSYTKARTVLRHEYDIARTLFEHGVSVPRPYGIIERTLLEEDGRTRTVSGFVMERIDGVSGHDLSSPDEKADHLLQHIRTLYGRELRKARQLFRPGDWSGNFMYNAKEDRVYMIDFHSWKRK